MEAVVVVRLASSFSTQTHWLKTTTLALQAVVEEAMEATEVLVEMEVPTGHMEQQLMMETEVVLAALVAMEVEEAMAAVVVVVLHTLYIEPVPPILH